MLLHKNCLTLYSRAFLIEIIRINKYQIEKFVSLKFLSACPTEFELTHHDSQIACNAFFKICDAKKDTKTTKITIQWMFSYRNFFAKKSQDRNFNIHLHCLMYFSRTFLCVFYAYLVHILHVCIFLAYVLHILCIKYCAYIYFMYSSQTLCCVYASRMSHVYILTYVRCWLQWKTVVDFIVFFHVGFSISFFSKLTHHIPPICCQNIFATQFWN